MRKLAAQIESVLLPGMHLPEVLRSLFAWIEDRGLYIDRPTGERIGLLFPEAEMKAGWTDAGRPGGTDISFFAEGNVNLKYWFGHERPEVLSRLCVFAQTGAEGSMAAFWLNDQGRQLIVHLGSGSGSTTVCVLAETAIDFLRLLAIGYEEICWGDQLSVTPAEANSDFVVQPNAPFNEWLVNTFNTDIPARGTDIVKHPDDMAATDTLDAFNRWVSENVA
jgi:hypothetical protein